MDEIPVVDMESAEFDGLSPDEHLSALGDQIYEALKGIGFVYLLNTGIPASLRESTAKEAMQFFSLPLETKMKYHRFVRTHCNGYTPMREEMLSRTEGADLSIQELKEAWDMKVPGEDMPEAEAPAFSRDLVQLMTSFERLSQRLLAALEVGAGRPGLLTPLHRHQLRGRNGAVMRVVHYPPVPEHVPAGAVRCATHSDWGFLTLLLQDQAGGLEVLNRAGRWVPAPAVPDAVLLNVGDLAEIWTGGHQTGHQTPRPAAGAGAPAACLPALDGVLQFAGRRHDRPAAGRRRRLPRGERRRVPATEVPGHHAQRPPPGLSARQR